MEITNKPTPPPQHVAVFAFPFGSHVAVILSLVRRLADASPGTTFSLFNTAKSNKFVSTMLASDGNANIKVYDIDDGLPEGHVMSHNPQEPVDYFLKGATLDKYRKSVEIAVEESGGREISCFVGDAFMLHAAELAAEMNVPWVCLWIASASSLAGHIFTDQIRDKFGVTGIAGREDETLDSIPGLSEIRVSDLQEGIITGNLESPFGQMLEKMGRKVLQATTLVVNSFEELEPSITNHLKPMFKNFLHVGPLTLTLPQPSSQDIHGCLPWLDKHENASVAYISFGNVITPPPHELVALAEAVEQSGVPFLWSIKDHMKHHLPEGFIERMTRDADRGKIVSWAPQLQVLAHRSVGVYVNHCGWNSVLESISGGVPMVCRPFFADHGINIRMVESVWKIGVGVKGGKFTKSGTIESLEQVLFSDGGVKMRKNIAVFKELGNKAVGPNGSSIENCKCLLQF